MEGRVVALDQTGGRDTSRKRVGARQFPVFPDRGWIPAVAGRGCSR